MFFIITSSPAEGGIVSFGRGVDAGKVKILKVDDIENAELLFFPAVGHRGKDRLHQSDVEIFKADV